MFNQTSQLGTTSHSWSEGWLSIKSPSEKKLANPFDRKLSIYTTYTHPKETRGGINVTLEGKLTGSDFPVLVTWRILIMHEQHQIAVCALVLSMFKWPKDGTDCSL